MSALQFAPEGAVPRRSASAAAPALAPPIVHDVLRGGGKPLDAGVRARMEPRFQHSFADVRVHADARAAESARAVGAHAYAVGRDVVFGTGRYAPGSAEGDRTIAHELAHVVQQRGAPSPIQPKLEIGAADDAAEREADAAAGAVARGARAKVSAGTGGGAGLRRQAADGPHLIPPLRYTPLPPQPLFRPGEIPEAIVLPAPPQITLVPPGPLGGAGPGTQPRLVPPLQANLPAPVTITWIPRCVPQRPLTWADFAGTPGRGAAALTHVDVRRSTPQGNLMFQAVLNTGRSWVQPKHANAADPARNGCAQQIASCTRHFANRPAGWSGTWSMNSGACAASIVSPVVAHDAAECASDFGPDCTRAAVDESARLLQHEQGHFDLICALVNRANDALRAGSAAGPVTTALNREVPAQTTDYDTQTSHGCLAGAQAAWEAAIAAGLPAVSIP
jgi:hypothetical protein